jgi:hypothetical protein
MVGWLVAYQAQQGEKLKVGIEPTVRLDDHNEPQPDVVLFRVGGNAQIDTDGYLTLLRQTGQVDFLKIVENL